MLRVTIEIFPRGDESRRRTIGVVDITNTGTGDPTTGNYAVTMAKDTTRFRPGVWRRGTVSGFPRLRLGAYDLLLRALVACGLGPRNPEAAESLAELECDGEGVSP